MTLDRTNRWLWAKDIARHVCRLACMPRRLVKVIAKNWRTISRSDMLLAALPLCEAGRFDICHAHFAGEGDAMARLRALRLLGCPLVATLHGYDVTKGSRGDAGRYPHLFEHADAIVVTTRFMASVVSAMGCPQAKLHQMPIGIAAEQFRFSPRHWQSGEPLRLLTVARLVEKKGVEYAIRAVTLLIETGISVQYAIVGDGPLRSQLESLAKQLNVNDSVRFFGAQTRSSILEHYAACHLFVFPSCKATDGDQEGQGIVAVEAQACGIPIIASRSGGIPEVVIDSKTGALVPERDPVALAEAIQQLAARHDEWPSIGREGRTWVEAAFSHRLFMERTENLYHTALGGGRVT